LFRAVLGGGVVRAGRLGAHCGWRRVVGRSAGPGHRRAGAPASSAVAARSATPRHRKTCMCCGGGARSCATRWRCSRRCSTTPRRWGPTRTGDARRGTVLVDGTVCPTGDRRHVPGIVAHVTGLIGPYTDPRYIVQSASGEVRRQFAVLFRASPLSGRPRANRRETSAAAWVTLARTGRVARASVDPRCARAQRFPHLNGRRTPRRTSGSSRLTRSRRCRYVAAVQGSAAPPTGGSVSIGVLPWEHLFLRPRHRTAS
jgi:hypothetical protein